MKQSGNSNHRFDHSHHHATSPESARFDPAVALELKMTEARLGDEQALAGLVIHHRPFIETSAERMLQVTQLASTINVDRVTDRTVDLAIKLFPTNYQEHRSMKGFRSWLRALVKNQIRDLNKFVHSQIRDYRRVKPLTAVSNLPVGDLHHSPPDIVIREEENRGLQLLVQRALGGLNDRDRQLILMRHYLEWPWAKIADVLSMPSTASAKTAGWRAMALLRGRLESTDQRA